MLASSFGTNASLQATRQACSYLAIKQLNVVKRPLGSYSLASFPSICINGHLFMDTCKLPFLIVRELSMTHFTTSSCTQSLCDTWCPSGCLEQISEIVMKML